MRSIDHSFTWLRFFIVSASMALSSHSNGGMPSGGRPAGTWKVRSFSESPLWRWVVNLRLASISWMMAMTYQGTPVALATWS